MKKKLLFLFLAVCVVFSVCACGKKKEAETEEAKVDEVKTECMNFVGKQLPSIAQDRNEAVSLYNKDFAASTVDTTVLLTDLKETAIPRMETYINNLTAFETKTEEVTELKNYYLQSAQKQYEAMKMVVSAVEGENPDYLMQADNLINEAKTLLSEFDTKLAAIASAHGFTVQTASSTDAE